jgi:hypothetical protein
LVNSVLGDEPIQAAPSGPSGNLVRRHGLELSNQLCFQYNDNLIYK